MLSPHIQTISFNSLLRQSQQQQLRKNLPKILAVSLSSPSNNCFSSILLDFYFSFWKSLSRQSQQVLLFLFLQQTAALNFNYLQRSSLSKISSYFLRFQALSFYPFIIRIISAIQCFQSVFVFVSASIRGGQYFSKKECVRQIHLYSTAIQFGINLSGTCSISSKSTGRMYFLQSSLACQIRFKFILSELLQLLFLQGQLQSCEPR